MKKYKEWILIILAGVVTGVASIVLTASGNPGNMGFCIACFLRDIAGAVGLHSAAVVQCFRFEIIGLLLGSFIIALLTKEFKPKGGSSPITRFLIAVFVMVGALMFLGCPLRMIIRLGGGDLNALVGLVGFACGILVGIVALKKGFTLKRNYTQPLTEGLVSPFTTVLFSVLALAVPTLFIASTEGPGSMHAFWVIALVAGLVVGALAQKSRLCMVGGIRDAIMFKDFKLITGFVAILVTIVIGNLCMGNFKLSFDGQPVAHTDALWNFLGMLLVGWGSVLLGGCPLRQIILAGEGNSDSGITVLGFIAGAAICHNFKLASSAAGPTTNGMIAVVIGFVVLAIITVLNSRKKV